MAKRSRPKRGSDNPSVTGSPAIDGLIIVLLLLTIPGYFVMKARARSAAKQQRERALKVLSSPFLSTFGEWSSRYYRSRNRLTRDKLESLPPPSNIGKMALFYPNLSRSSLDKVSLALSAKCRATSPKDVETLVVFERKMVKAGQYVNSRTRQKYGSVHEETCKLVFIDVRNWTIIGFQQFQAEPLPNSSSGAQQRALVDDSTISEWLESRFTSR